MLLDDKDPVHRSLVLQEILPNTLEGLKDDNGQLTAKSIEIRNHTVYFCIMAKTLKEKPSF